MSITQYTIWLLEVSSWENNLFLWAIYTMAMLVITRGYNMCIYIILQTTHDWFIISYHCITYYISYKVVPPVIMLKSPFFAHQPSTGLSVLSSPVDSRELNAELRASSAKHLFKTTSYLAVFKATRHNGLRLLGFLE